MLCYDVGESYCMFSDRDSQRMRSLDNMGDFSYSHRDGEASFFVATIPIFVDICNLVIDIIPMGKG